MKVWSGHQFLNVDHQVRKADVIYYDPGAKYNSVQRMFNKRTENCIYSNLTKAANLCFLLREEENRHGAK